jgi:hypothetical protein
MNAERLFKIVIMELTNDIMKLEQDLEGYINSELDSEAKVNAIKSTLSKIVNAEASLTKFTKMMSNGADNKNKK